MKVRRLVRQLTDLGIPACGLKGAKEVTRILH